MNKKQERQTAILSMLQKAPGLSVKRLAETLGVSEMTIRRDIGELQAKDYITSIQGVVILNKNQDGSSIVKEYSLTSEHTVMSEAKRRIGALASTLIEPNDTILVDTGTTTEQLFPHLRADIPLTVLCYNLNILLSSQNFEGIDIICAGGFYHRNTQMFESPEAVSLISRIVANKYFCSAAGVSQKGAVTCIEQYELPSKQAAIKSAMTKILLADSSKFGKIRPCMFAHLTEFDVIVTDENISDSWVAYFKECGIECMIA